MTKSLSEEVAQRYREAIWSELSKVGRPDSRFHWDFSSFIADFEGSEACTEQVAALESYRRSELVFVTPDNSTEGVRRRLLADGKPFIMTTYGIGRGFLRFEPDQVPPPERSYAASLDGADRYAVPVTLRELGRGPSLGLLVTGGSAVSRNGVRFGKGHGYFDLEWAMLSEIEAVDSSTEIADVVHDCQIVDEDLEPRNHDVPVDWIVTPTRTLHASGVVRQPGRVRWEMLEGTRLGEIPPLRELREMQSGL